MLSPSQNTLPLLYPQPASVSTTLFRGVFNRGAALVIPVTALSVAASAYLTYTAPAGSTERRLYAISGAVTFAMLPMTQIVMMPGIHRFMDLSKGDATAQEKAAASGEVLKLLKAWAAQNWVRVVFSKGMFDGVEIRDTHIYWPYRAYGKPPQRMPKLSVLSVVVLGRAIRANEHASDEDAAANAAATMLLYRAKESEIESA
ncbi:hypothetical protein B0A55_00378 [Friedmanniomyces simplex]|uniref:Uncharacterized protein n=1 Tax=Friedmanniomyces simplex TaxID=329884 RepID=A0A4U0Y7C4_9PEZI|nr:hypothetical protein B0A55_00378 [Friedmanniomyces simplex]